MRFYNIAKISIGLEAKVEGPKMKKRLAKLTSILLMFAVTIAYSPVAFAETELMDAGTSAETSCDVDANGETVSTESVGGTAGQAEAASSSDTKNQNAEETGNTQETETTVSNDDESDEGEDLSDLQVEEVDYINPLYDEIITDDDLPEPAELSDENDEDADEDGSSATLSAIDSSVKYCTSVSEASSSIKNDLVNRTTEFKIGREYSSRDECYNALLYGDEITEILEGAYKHDGVSTEGDYLKYHVGGASISASTTSSGGVYYSTIVYKMKYLATSSNEKTVTSEVNNVLNSLNLDGKSDEAKIVEMYKWIAKNVKYDYSGAKDSSNLKCHSAYAAIHDKKAVCQGYATLLYRMALEEGIDARVVAGYNGASGHAWNIIKLNGKYYYMDATWDAGRSSYKYMLKGKSEFMKDHGIYKQVSMGATYSINSSSYSFAPSSTYISKLSAASKAFTAKWSGKSNSQVSGYQVRYSKKSSMGSSSTKTYSSYKTTSAKISKLSKKKKYYVQVRTYRKAYGSTYYSGWSSKKSIKTK